MTTRPTDLYQYLASLPKVDLHRHLEGSIRPETFLELVLPQPDIALPTRDAGKLLQYVEVRDGDAPDFLRFLQKFALLHYMYTSPEIIQRIVREVIEDAAVDRVVHLELRFSLSHLTKRANFEMGDVIRWIHEARVQAECDFNIRVLLVPMINREATHAMAERITNAVLAQSDGVISALDLAGDELNVPVPAFADLFERARERGLQINVHAGEVGTAAVMKTCLECFRPARIGHGVRAAEGAEVMALLKKQNVVLEVCPTSNVQTGASRSLREHQLKQLYEAGVKVTINTDDPRVSRTTLTNEYCLAVEQIGLSLETVKQLIVAAAEASYLPPAEKNKLVQYLKAEISI